MTSPSYREFKSLAARGNLVPVFSEYLADAETPVSLFLKLAGAERKCFLLESAEVEEKIGRYSIVGLKPRIAIELSGNQLRISGRGAPATTRIFSQSELFTRLRHVFSSIRFVATPVLPAFVAGFVGYLGYEFVRWCDDVQFQPKGKQPTSPDTALFLMENLAVYDHLERKIKLVHLADCSKQSPKTAYQQAVRALQSMERKIQKPLSAKLTSLGLMPTLSGPQLRSNVSKNIFERQVNKIKQYIRAGDCIQTVLSQRFDLGKIKNDFLVYRVLRSLNPSPYMFYFRHQKIRLIGSSPEMLVKKDGHHVETRPIAGTRPRGATEQIDRAFEASLLASKKEMAEHLMLVDLGRNDLGRVCDFKSIRVSEFAQVERYSHVMHLVSRVVGHISAKRDMFDLLRACFPAGTVTGAPKIRAMQIIDELEPARRGPYAGALGVLALNGDMNVCITIRTIVIERGNAFVQAGAGIVLDSQPAKEYQETVNKAKALLHAVQMARSLS